MVASELQRREAKPGAPRAKKESRLSTPLALRDHLHRAANPHLLIPQTEFAETNRRALRHQRFLGGGRSRKHPPAVEGF
jgi:hypothetical protein